MSVEEGIEKKGCGEMRGGERQSTEKGEIGATEERRRLMGWNGRMKVANRIEQNDDRG